MPPVSGGGGGTAYYPYDDSIPTHHDSVPNFAKTPTIMSAQSGNWSSTSTWNLGRVPQSGDVVGIQTTHTVTYDVNASGTVSLDSVGVAGTLTFSTSATTSMKVKQVLVYGPELLGEDGYGELRIGTVGSSVDATVTATVIIRDVACDTGTVGTPGTDPRQYGMGVLVWGRIRLHGAAKTSWLRVAATPLAAATTLTLASSPTGWRASDLLVLPDTRQLKDNEISTNYVAQWETPTLSSVSGTTATLSAGLGFNHYPAKDHNGTVSYYPHVGNLTRNITFKSENKDGNRGHVQFFERADIDTRYAAFEDLGRTTLDALDSTTYSGNTLTHVGTNQQARYPFHIHHLIGPTSPQSNGYQFTVIGCSVYHRKTVGNIRWAYTVHGSHYGLVEDCVSFNCGGAGIMCELGNETEVLFNRNAIFVTPNLYNYPWIPERADSRGTSDTGHEGAGAWFRGPNIRLTNNVFACSYSYGIVYWMSSAPQTRFPSYQGADTEVSGQYTLHYLYELPLLEFDNNEVYGATASGMTIWSLGTNGAYLPVASMPTSTVSDFKCWHTFTNCYFGYETQNLLLSNPVFRGDFTVLADTSPSTVGVGGSDYYHKGFVVDGADIQGQRYGVYPTVLTDGPYTVRNSYLCNHTNVLVENAWSSTYHSDNLPPKLIQLDNLTFDQPSYSSTFYNVRMYYVGSGTRNLIQLDEVFVTDYDGTPGDDFQVYYTEQAPSFVVPQQEPATGGPPYTLTASPVSGKTNAQNWSDYGIAIAGAVSPTSSTRSLIAGFVG